MKERIRILGAADLERFRAAIFAAFSKPCFAILSAFIIVGHALAYDRDLLSFSWNPSHTSPMSGIVYLILLICSVLAHELGHMSAAIYRGDSSAEAFLRFNSWLPAFMTRSGPGCSSTSLQSPALSLAGIYFQLLFASILGYVFLLTDYALIPASVLLIDMGILASLAPTPGTDGYWFLVDLQRKEGLQESGLGSRCTEKTERSKRGQTIAQQNRIGRISFVLGINLTILYVMASAVLLLGTVHQLLNGTIMTYQVDGFLKLPEFLAYLILLIPAVVYAFWALLKARFILPIIMNLARNLND